MEKFYTDKEFETNVYNNIICALTHNLDTCDHCQKCGKDSGVARTNLIRELAVLLDQELPWEE